MTHTRGFLITAVTGKLYTDFDQLYAQTSEILGVSVFTHQLGPALKAIEKFMPEILRRYGYPIEEFKAHELDPNIEWTFELLNEKYDLNKEYVIEYTEEDINNIRRTYKGDGPDRFIQGKEIIVVSL